MSKRTWLQVWCEYEGPNYNANGETFKILVETNEFDEAYNMIRNNEELIDDFVEHSIRESKTIEKEYRLQEVIDLIDSHTGIRWAISHNEQVYSLSRGKVIKRSK